MYILQASLCALDLGQENVKIFVFHKKVGVKVWLFRGKAVLLHPLSRTMPLAAGSGGKTKELTSSTLSKTKEFFEKIT